MENSERENLTWIINLATDGLEELIPYLKGKVQMESQAIELLADLCEYRDQLVTEVPCE